MYVCVCKAVTEREVHAAIRDGARSLRELRTDLGIIEECGRCAGCARQCLRDAETGGLVPSARIRMYRDARMAEVLHYHADLRLEQALGPLPPARTIFERRVRKSSFLNRWLEYLAAQGHSIGTLMPTPGVAPKPLEAIA